ncbi:SUMO-specific isopeptidase USPL1 [Hoplias malabaricus]|uniref:SUMO-specific isopeptidase USPL1 n=1 Tax=Hoplias malabaricus TaxID=27720 RepID=UPI0034635AAE
MPSMNSGNSGVGLLSLPLVGCLGKDEDKARITGDCPWCSAKGETSALCSYAVNFTETITLCSSPLCLFPLVSRPLEDVCDSLISAEKTKVCKRKSHLSEPEDPNPKRQKKEHCERTKVGEYGITESFEEEIFDNNPEEKIESGNQIKTTCTEAPAASIEVSLLSDATQFEEYVSSTQDEAEEAPQMDIVKQDLIKFVPAQLHLFWRNKDNLCWLNALMVALVHLKVLSETVIMTEDFSVKSCIVRNLCSSYKKTCAYVKIKEQVYQGNVHVPSDVLQKAEQELEALQLSVFQFLQPKLQCELGQEETPVFALPLLLKSDEWAQSLFQHTGQWEFQCTSCHHTLITSTEKTITTFTQISADWHPLRAIHRAQCSKCYNKTQRRRLVFQRLSPVLAVHFVEGLPWRDVSKYSFSFKGMSYDIRIIIQYNEKLKHFVTWIHQPNGSWLEFDDLKYPNCKTHRHLTLPASQFHLVFWEAESRSDSQLLKQDTPMVEFANTSVSFEDVANSVTNDTCLIEALIVNEDENDISSMHSSISNTTLLDTFEGLSHSDIVTLTLVEVKVDAEGKPLPNSQETVALPSESSISEPSVLQPQTSLCQAPAFLQNKTNGSIASTPVPSEMIPPSVVKPLVPREEHSQMNQHLPTLHTSNTKDSPQQFLLHSHPSLQSTPHRVTLTTSQTKPDLKCEGSEALPAKPAELFDGFRTKNSINPVFSREVVRQPLTKLSGSNVPLPQKHFSCSSLTDAKIHASEIKSVAKTTTDLPAASPALSTTDALRQKLMKKLKAKKKKLAKLNQLLGKNDKESTPRPDSTNLTSPYSPYSVTSSTSVYDSSAYDHFFADLLSTSTISSNLSPDSTVLLEMLTSSQGGETSDSNPPEQLVQDNSNFSASVFSDPCVNNDPCSTNEDFLDEFISGSGGQQSTIESGDFNGLDVFF